MILTRFVRISFNFYFSTKDNYSKIMIYNIPNKTNIFADFGKKYLIKFTERYFKTHKINDNISKKHCISHY